MVNGGRDSPLFSFVPAFSWQFFSARVFMPSAHSVAARLRSFSPDQGAALSGTALALVAFASLTTLQNATAEDGYEIIEALGGTYSTATGLSGDGTVMVGKANSAGGQAYRWTATGGAQSIHDQSWSASHAFAISGDGTTIVGYWGSGSTETAFYWTQALGGQSLLTLG
jgi:hypothetical protein